MKKLSMMRKIVAVASILTVSSAAVMAQETVEKSTTLDDLLKKVEAGRYSEARSNSVREARFKAAKSEQIKLLNDMKAERTRLEKLSVQKEKQFEENQKLVVAAQKRLKERLGTLAELFGHLTSAAGDMRSNFEVSLTSAQFPGREEFIDGLVAKMSDSDKLPTVAEIERLWGMLQREMTESGRIVNFEAEVIAPNGDVTQETVTRVGSFNIVTSDGRYLSYSNGSLKELARQPLNRYVGWGADLAQSSDGMSPFGVDPTGPTGGSLLKALIGTPTLEERWHQGGYVGYAITALGFVALIIAVWRFIVLTSIGAKVNAQMKSSTASEDNPLGRVLKVHEDNPSMNVETLELKLSEQILKEIPNLEKMLGGLKIIAAVAPLMGLLGTVTGMIITFQAITIFGAGDPKAMAGGISGALITTVLGLLVAIPTVLMHTMVSARSKKVIHVLEEQSTGIIAERSAA